VRDLGATESFTEQGLERVAGGRFKSGIHYSRRVLRRHLIITDFQISRRTVLAAEKGNLYVKYSKGTGIQPHRSSARQLLIFRLCTGFHLLTRRLVLPRCRHSAEDLGALTVLGLPSLDERQEQREGIDCR
jgi:hypothetical protein